MPVINKKTLADRLGPIFFPPGPWQEKYGRYKSGQGRNDEITKKKPGRFWRVKKTLPDIHNIRPDVFC